MWGKENEEAARQEYAELMSDHADLEVRSSGLWVCESYPFLGASPDAMVSCTCCGEGILEIKCPYSLREASIKESCGKGDFCLSAEGELKQSHQYYHQIQLQLLVTKRDFCDFLIWTPAETAIQRVSVDSSWRSSNPPKLEAFWSDHVLPRILAPGAGQVDAPNIAQPVVHCSCGNVDSGNMIGCDNASCPHEWYHWECVGLRKEPPRKRAWYCPSCQHVAPPARKRAKKQP